MSQVARIDIRTDARRKGIIARAAELLNTNVTQFILDRVVPDAERIVAEKESQKIRLAADDWAELCKRLDAAPKDLPKMRELLTRPSRFVDADEQYRHFARIRARVEAAAEGAGAASHPDALARPLGG